MTKYFNKDGVEFKVGDKVKVVQKVTETEDGMGPGVKYDNDWVSNMSDNIGKEFTIKSVSTSGVYFTDAPYGYPITALENLSYKAEEIEVGDLVEIICDQSSSVYRGKIGTTGIVASVDFEREWTVDGSEDIISLEGCNGRGQFRYRFKLVTKAKDIVKVQATPELKPFQRVKLRNGMMAIVYSATKISFEDNAWTTVRFKPATSWDAEWVIATVYEAPTAAYALDFSRMGDIVWESEDVKAEKEAQIKQEKIAEAAAQVEATKVAFGKASVALREAQAALEAVK